jgi:hypothetical protein
MAGLGGAINHGTVARSHRTQYQYRGTSNSPIHSARKTPSTFGLVQARITRFTTSMGGYLSVISVSGLTGLATILRLADPAAASPVCRGESVLSMIDAAHLA